MKRATLILCALLCMASRHPDRMIRSDLALNVSFNRGDATTRSTVTHTPTLAGDAAVASGTNFLVVDGTGDRVVFADSDSLDMTGDMTASIWVKKASAPAATSIIAAKYAFASSGWIMFIDSAGKANFDGRLGAGYIVGPETAASICNNAWRHVCIVRSGSSWSLYLDGALAQSTTPGTGTFENAQPLSLGDADAGTGYFAPLAASLDEFRLYTRALSAAEVAAISSSGRE